MSIRVVLADDHTLMRECLQLALKNEQDIQVVAEARDGRSAVALAREYQPDVIIMDVTMPDMDGIEAAREILRDGSGPCIIALSMHSSRRLLTDAFEAGIVGYLHKDCSYEELPRAIRVVLGGRKYVSPTITARLMETVRAGDSAEPSVWSVLTDRERQVLQLLAEGRDKLRIAETLHISRKTVEAHRLRIMKKLHLDSVAKLTKYAIQQGLVHPDE